MKNDKYGGKVRCLVDFFSVPEADSVWNSGKKISTWIMRLGMMIIIIIIMISIASYSY